MLAKRLIVSMFAIGLTFSSAHAARVLLLEKDQDALQARADLILQAKNEVLAEYFSVWNDDESLGGLSLLVYAAQNGRKVKIIMDALSNKVPDSLMAALLDHGVDKDGNQNLEIKLYNKLNIFKPLKALHRDHAKLLIADGDRLIIGGRNVGDKYFGANGKRNFRDLDVLTEGQAGIEARDSFMEVWNSKLATRPDVSNFSEERREKICPHNRKDNGRCKAAVRYLNEQFTLSENRIHHMLDVLMNQRPTADVTVDSGRDWLENVEDFDDIKFMSHRENKLVTDKTNHLSDSLAEIALGTKEDLNIISPYLIPTDKLMKVLKELKSRTPAVRVRIITNSLNSTDNLFAQIGYKESKDKIINLGIELYEYNGPDTAHAKAAVIDGKTVLIGTYNLDPRSSEINREVGVMISSPEQSQLAKDLTHGIETFRANSLLVGKDGKKQNEERWDENVSKTKKMMLEATRILYPYVKDQL
ncbi:MAG: phospholipase D family protein [Bdellovibrionales bacterium]|nr:phospholipase D family protein [Bdellovibrionales bacterium]